MKLTSSKEDVAVSHIAGLVLVNAMIFQEILADHNELVRPLQFAATKPNPGTLLSEHWKFITDNINYYPIFHVATEILEDLTSNADIEDGLRVLIRGAQAIVGKRAALRHDLMGRVYHRLLTQAKYLGTYYTGIPAAAMLLKLTLPPRSWNVDWADLKSIEKLRIADFACGTGTLLMATADAITDNYVSVCAAENKPIDLAALHKILAESVLKGYDVLPSAIHLTASSLALRAPRVEFKKMGLYNLPLGGPGRKLGSIEFFRSRRIQIYSDLFGSKSQIGSTISGTGETELVSAIADDLDLCVINPPFVRSVGGNLLFGSVPKIERTSMQKDLRNLVKSTQLTANITAGLGSVFVALADKYIKPGGRLALVLPKALLSGVAWSETRDLLKKNYAIEYLIVSHDPHHWNFSESTSLSEVLVVAVKLDSKKTTSVVTKCLNLWKNPTTAAEALAIANKLLRVESKKPSTETIKISEKIAGMTVSVNWDELKSKKQWIIPCGFAQSELYQCANDLSNGKLKLPRNSKIVRLPLCEVGKLFKIGPDVRDIHDGFEPTSSPTLYPAVWNNDSKTTKFVSTLPNMYLNPLEKPPKGRKLKPYAQMWPLAGRLVVAERLRLNSQRIFCMRVSEKVLANSWWVLAWKDKDYGEKAEKAVALWFNSTIGILQSLSSRVETEGAWVKFKKPTLNMLPILDVRELSSSQLNKLASAFDDLGSEELLPFAKIGSDPTRKRIDDVISQTLKLGDLADLRTLIGREPFVCLESL
jgi:hypothetical protein